MKVKIFVNDTDVSSFVLLTSMSISTELSNKTASCSFTMHNLPSVGGSTFPLPIPFTLAGDMDLRNMLSVRVEDALDDTKVLFGGFITTVDYAPVLPEDCQYSIQCQGWLKLLDNYQVSVDYESTVTDQEILEDLCSEHLPTWDTSGVEQIVTFSQFKMDGTIREVLEALASYSNAEFYVDGSQCLFYNNDGFDTAPFQLGAGHVAFRGHKFSSDFSERANQVRCSGIDIVTNEPFSIVVDDEEAQAEWGSVFPYTANESFSSEVLATLYANAELERRSQPKESGSFILNEPGLEPGQWVTLSDPILKFNNRTFLVRSVSQKWLTPDRCEFSVTYGSYSEDLADMLIGIQKTANMANQPRAAVIPSGGVTGGMLADGILNELAKFGPAIRPIVVVSSLPSLPDSEYPPDSYVFRSSDSKIYRNVSGTWTESTAPVGTYMTYNTGLFQATNMVGVLLANQIGSVNVSTLVGEINSAAGVVVNANSIVGTMPGTVTIQGGSIQALFNSGSTVSIHGSLLTNNTVPGDAIVNINGSKIQNLTISGNAIQNGVITDTKIGDMNVSKLTAGNVEFGGATTIGYNSDFKLSLQSNAIRIQAATDKYFQATSSSATLVFGSREIKAESGSITLTYDNNTTAILNGSGISFSRGSNQAIVSSSGFKAQAGTGGPYTEASAGGCVVWADTNNFTTVTAGGVYIKGTGGLQLEGSGGIGIGHALFASSPVRINSSGVLLTMGGHSANLTASGLSFSASSGGTLTVTSSGVQVTVGNFNCVVGNITTGNGYIRSTSGSYTAEIRATMFGGLYIHGNQVVGSRGSAIANATDAASAITQLNALLAACRTHGLIAT